MKTINAQITLTDENINSIAAFFQYKDTIQTLQDVTKEVTDENGDVTKVTTQETVDTPNPVSKEDFVTQVFKQEVVQRFANILAQDALKQIDSQVAQQKEQTASVVVGQVNEAVDVTIE